MVAKLRLSILSLAMLSVASLTYAEKPPRVEVVPKEMLAIEIEERVGIGGLRALADGVTLTSLLNARLWDTAKDHVGPSAVERVGWLQREAEKETWPGVGAFIFYTFNEKTGQLILAFEYGEGPYPTQKLLLTYKIDDKPPKADIYITTPGP